MAFVMKGVGGLKCYKGFFNFFRLVWLYQPENVNFEPIIRGLKNDNFDWDQV